MMRLFIALALPRSLRRSLERLQNMQHGIHGVRWVPPANMHLTLRFLGDTQESRLEDLHVALERITAPAFELTLRGAGEFSHGQDKQSLWIGAEPSPALSQLHEKIETLVQREDFPPDRRRFTPHITVARFGRSMRPIYIEQFIVGNALFTAGPETIPAFTLYRSYLGKRGATYVPLAHYPLEGANPEDVDLLVQEAEEAAAAPPAWL